MRWVEALRPAWPSCMAIRADEFVCTNVTMRRQASACSGFHRPVHHGEMRASGLTSVIST